MKYTLYSAMVVLFIANMGLTYWGIKKISHATVVFESANQESQNEVLQSTDELIRLLKKNKSINKESIELIHKKIDQVINFEHEERRIWIDNMYSFATIVISVLALFTVFIPIVTHLSFADQLKDLSNKMTSLTEQKKEIDNLLFVISKIDIYQFQSSILQIISPYQIRASTTRSDEIKNMFVKIFTELKSRVDEIISNIDDERIKNGKIGDLLKTSLIQFSLNIKGLYLLFIFKSKVEYKLLSDLEISLNVLVGNYKSKEKWTDFGNKIESLKTKLSR